MAKTILFSKYFPAYHPRAGEPTFFAEKICKYLSSNGGDNAQKLTKNLLRNNFGTSDRDSIFPKLHTIRNGHRWKENEYFSPRIWSGPPYASKQIRIAEDLRIKHLWDIMILPSMEVFINGQLFGFYGSPEVELLAQHDGLSNEDFQNWFSKLPFDGQIICWDDHVEY